MRQGPSFPFITLWSHVESSRITWWLCRYTGYVCYGLAGLWVCLLFFMRKRISMAIGVIKEASRAVGAMKAGRVGHALLPCSRGGGDERGSYVEHGAVYLMCVHSC